MAYVATLLLPDCGAVNDNSAEQVKQKMGRCCWEVSNQATKNQIPQLTGVHTRQAAKRQKTNAGTDGATYTQVWEVCGKLESSLFPTHLTAVCYC